MNLLYLTLDPGGDVVAANDDPVEAIASTKYAPAGTRVIRSDNLVTLMEVVEAVDSNYYRKLKAHEERNLRLQGREGEADAYRRTFK